MARPTRIFLRRQDARRELASYLRQVSPAYRARGPSRRSWLRDRAGGWRTRSGPFLPDGPGRCAGGGSGQRRIVGRRLRDREWPLPDQAYLQRRELESRTTRAVERTRNTGV